MSSNTDYQTRLEHEQRENYKKYQRLSKQTKLICFAPLAVMLVFWVFGIRPESVLVEILMYTALILVSVFVTVSEYRLYSLLGTKVSPDIPDHLKKLHEHYTLRIYSLIFTIGLVVWFAVWLVVFAFR